MTGKELQIRRLHRGQSLEAAAAELGMTVAALTALEQSDGVVPARGQRVFTEVKLPRGPGSTAPKQRN